jgi:Fic family protein
MSEVQMHPNNKINVKDVTDRCNSISQSLKSCPDRLTALPRIKLALIELSRLLVKQDLSQEEQNTLTAAYHRLAVSTYQLLKNHE